MNWSPNSWRSKNAKHIPNDYPSAEALAEVENTLSKKPPLVVASEIEKLKKELAKVSRGEAFLLQGGDCAESFSEFEADRIIRYFRIETKSLFLPYSNCRIPIDQFYRGWRLIVLVSYLLARVVLPFSFPAY